MKGYPLMHLPTTRRTAVPSTENMQTRLNETESTSASVTPLPITACAIDAVLFVTRSPAPMFSAKGPVIDQNVALEHLVSGCVQAFAYARACACVSCACDEAGAPRVWRVHLNAQALSCFVRATWNHAATEIQMAMVELVSVIVCKQAGLGQLGRTHMSL